MHTITNIEISENKTRYHEIFLVIFLNGFVLKKFLSNFAVPNGQKVVKSQW